MPLNFYINPSFPKLPLEKLAQTSIGTINTVMEVRIKAGVTTGTVSGFIQNAIAGISKTVSVSGFVSTAPLSNGSDVGSKNTFSLKVYPNPFISHCIVEVKSEVNKPEVIKLTDLAGNIIF